MDLEAAPDKVKLEGGPGIGSVILVASEPLELAEHTIREHFGMPFTAFAEQLGVSTTALKRACTKAGIHRWPYRYVKALDRKISTLEESTSSIQRELTAIMSGGFVQGRVKRHGPLTDSELRRKQTLENRLQLQLEERDKLCKQRDGVLANPNVLMSAAELDAHRFKGVTHNAKMPAIRPRSAHYLAAADARAAAMPPPSGAMHSSEGSMYAWAAGLAPRGAHRHVPYVGTGSLQPLQPRQPQQQQAPSPAVLRAMWSAGRPSGLAGTGQQALGANWVAPGPAAQARAAAAAAAAAAAMGVPSLPPPSAWGAVDLGAFPGMASSGFFPTPHPAPAPAFAAPPPPPLRAAAPPSTSASVAPAAAPSVCSDNSSSRASTAAPPSSPSVEQDPDRRANRAAESREADCHRAPAGPSGG
eukprot:CAMPEP_0196772212 /NCGR_PEP_ID=MMETSP1104-20130614/2104_1 /TAXON_ID=33652 /ORGANISM="Cafeteria sp., Strain Caron Lab Isolate" /LENGTH=414 /DNA_ID=CAMNT_0042142345 /DNA_START=105 /DNA_END=1345 /DNA_ORIENTATION=-